MKYEPYTVEDVKKSAERKLFTVISLSLEPVSVVTYGANLAFKRLSVEPNHQQERKKINKNKMELQCFQTNFLLQHFRFLLKTVTTFETTAN